MIPFLTENYNDTRTLEDFDAPLEDTLGAAFRQGLSDNPTAQIYRLSKNYALKDTDHMMGVEDARKLFEENGVKYQIPATGISQAFAEELVRRRSERAARESIMARSPNSPAWQVSTQIAASLLDPVNIVSAFIPVVGQARYAGLVAKAGGIVSRMGVRAAVGAAEGAVGQAALEPLNYFANTQEGVDYHLSDTITNIAFGGVLGGGLHSIGGAVGDVIGRKLNRGEDVSAISREAITKTPGSAAEAVANSSPEIKQTALSSAIAQAARGEERLNIETIMEIDPSARRTTLTAAGENTRIQSALEDISKDITTLVLPETKTIRVNAPDGGHTSVEIKVEGRTATITGVTNFSTAKENARVLAAMDTIKESGYSLKASGELPYNVKRAVESHSGGKTPKSTRVDNPPPSKAELSERIETFSKTSRLTDDGSAASRSADAALKETPGADKTELTLTEYARKIEGEVAQFEKEYTALAEQTGLGVNRELAAASEAVSRSSIYAKAYDAIQICLLGT